MQCLNCGGLKEKAHYHIWVENGVITSVWYVSAGGYWDRELEKDEFYVEVVDKPKVYEGKSMRKLAECDCATNPDCVCCK